jgi:hypothetical protein
MDYPQALPINLEDRGVTVKWLKNVSEEELYRPKHNLTGNTLWTDLSVMAGFLKEKLIAKYASQRLGYHPTGGSKAVAERIMRSNAYDLLGMAVRMIEAGKMRREELQDALTRKHKKGGGVATKKVASIICNKAVEDHGSDVAAAAALGIPLGRLQYWLQFYDE